MALPPRALSAVNWSMMPVRAPTKPFSAAWQSCAIASGAISMPRAASNATATATSSAPDELNPAPTGISDATTASNPGPSPKRPLIWRATPRR